MPKDVHSPFSRIAINLDLMKNHLRSSSVAIDMSERRVKNLVIRIVYPHSARGKTTLSSANSSPKYRPILLHAFTLWRFKRVSVLTRSLNGCGMKPGSSFVKDPVSAPRRIELWPGNSMALRAHVRIMIYPYYGRPLSNPDTFQWLKHSHVAQP